MSKVLKFNASYKFKMCKRSINIQLINKKFINLIKDFCEKLYINVEYDVLKSINESLREVT